MGEKMAVRSIPGVEIRDNSIRISFTVRGQRHKKTFTVDGMVMAPTGPNVRAAARLVQNIKDAVRLGTFAMERWFPDDVTVLAQQAAARAKKRTVAQQMDIWRASLIAAESTAKGYDTAVRFWKHAPAAAPLEGQKWDNMPRLGSVAIDELVLSQVKAALASKAHRSGKTTNNYVSALKQALDLAVSDKLIADHPVVGRQVRRKWQEGQPDPFNKSEVARIVADMRVHYPRQVAAMCELWFLTGLRTSEIHGLRWSSVDLPAATILIHEVRVRGVHKATTKTDEDRQVRLPHRAVEILKQQMSLTFAGGEHVFDDPRNTPGPWDDERAFRRSYWTPTLKRLVIRYRKPYQCRHTNATMRLMAGQKLGYAAKQMGHTVDMFVNKYTDWINDGHSLLVDAKFEEFLAVQAPQAAASPAPANAAADALHPSSPEEVACSVSR